MNERRIGHSTHSSDHCGSICILSDERLEYKGSPLKWLNCSDREKKGRKF